MAYVPAITHSCGQLVLKGEDYLVLHDRGRLPTSAKTKNPLLRESLDSAQEAEADVLPRTSAGAQAKSSPSQAAQDKSYTLYCVFDGHNGKDAARHAKNTFHQTLHDRLPAGPIPRPGAKHWQAWCEALQSTMVGAFAELHESYACLGLPAGCTATAVLQTGQLLTIANLGDSRACLDTGNKVHQLTVDHRVATHKGERRRLQEAAVHIAPIGLDGEGPAQGPDSEGFGPLRMWPGGLCLSRAIGDFDVGVNVLCAPHIQQVLMPSSGCRVMVASDGVWDAFDSNGRVLRMVRSASAEKAPDKVLRTIKQVHTGVKDDATVILVDFMPAGVTFSELCQAKPGLVKSAGGSMRGGGCFCMGGPATTDDEPSAPKTKPPGAAELLTDMDVAACAGLLPDPEAVAPHWMDASWAQDIREIQGAAVEAWQAASSRKGMGQVLSRDDLAGYFERAHSKPIPQTRSQRLQDVGDYTVKFGVAPAPGAGAAPEPPTADASVHFRDAIASEGSYGQKFGHYAHDQIDSSTLPSSAENTNTSQHFGVEPGSVEDGPLADAASASPTDAPQTSRSSTEAKEAKRAAKQGRRVHILEPQR